MEIINILITLFFIALVIAAAFLSRGVVIIRRSQTMVIERLGTRPFALNAGLRFLVPVYHRPRPIMEKRAEQQPDGKIIGRYKLSERISLQQILLDFPQQNAITKDNAPIHIDALMFYQITDPIAVQFNFNLLVTFSVLFNVRIQSSLNIPVVSLSKQNSIPCPRLLEDGFLNFQSSMARIIFDRISIRLAKSRSCFSIIIFSKIEQGKCG